MNCDTDEPTCAVCNEPVSVADECAWEQGFDVCHGCAHGGYHDSKRDIAKLTAEVKFLRRLLHRQWDGCEPHTEDGKAAQAEVYKLVKRWASEVKP